MMGLATQPQGFSPGSCRSVSVYIHIYLHPVQSSSVCVCVCSIQEECLDDGFSYTAPGLHSWLTRVMYNRRSQFNPLWNTYVVGGVYDDKM